MSTNGRVRAHVGAKSTTIRVWEARRGHKFVGPQVQTKEYREHIGATIKDRRVRYALRGHKYKQKSTGHTEGPIL